MCALVDSNRLEDAIEKVEGSYKLKKGDTASGTLLDYNSFYPAVCCYIHDFYSFYVAKHSPLSFMSVLTRSRSFRFENNDYRPKCPIGEGTILTSDEVCR